MPLAEHPLHRSRRAALPHRAPTSGDNAESHQWIRIEIRVLSSCRRPVLLERVLDQHKILPQAVAALAQGNAHPAATSFDVSAALRTSYQYQLSPPALSAWVLMLSNDQSLVYTLPAVERQIVSLQLDLHHVPRVDLVGGDQARQRIDQLDFHRPSQRSCAEQKVGATGGADLGGDTLPGSRKGASPRPYQYPSTFNV